MMAPPRHPKRRYTIVRAFAEFLGIPTALIAGFLTLAVVTYVIDRSRIAWLEPARAVLRTHVFADAAATSALLSTIAAGIITVTSITISLLLLAVAQSAASMTSEVIDQFLRRRHNQVYFGFFIGLSLYALLTLATVSEPFNPVFGASSAFLLTVVALYLLLVLLYTSVNQMRTPEIVEAIHDHMIAARTRQLELVWRTRRTPSLEEPLSVTVRAKQRGFFTHVDLDLLQAAAGGDRETREIVLLVSIGSYVAFGDEIAVVRAATRENAERMADVVERAVRLERQRDVATDPAYGIEQLETIAWTSISSSKSNPAPGLLIIRTLRDALARWSVESHDAPADPPLPLVYTDNTFTQLLHAFESLAVVSSESMQHQSFTEIVHTFAMMFDRLPRSYHGRVEDLILRILSGMGDHVLTAELDAALSALAETLRRKERHEIALAVTNAQARLAQSVGVLASRSTRSRFT